MLTAVKLQISGILTSLAVVAAAWFFVRRKASSDTRFQVKLNRAPTVGHGEGL